MFATRLFRAACLHMAVVLNAQAAGVQAGSDPGTTVKGPAAPGGGGHVVVPESSMPRADGRMHTHYRIFVPNELTPEKDRR